jgi:hypothetical protein
VPPTSFAWSGNKLECGDPIINFETGINLNGERSHETFLLKPEATGFAFCKTARKPYDKVVTAILLRASQLAGSGICIKSVSPYGIGDDYEADSVNRSSDGLWEEWEQGRDMVLKLWPDDGLVCPWKKKEV